MTVPNKKRNTGRPKLGKKGGQFREEALMSKKSNDSFSPEWKRQMADLMRELDIVPEKFTGQVIVVFNQGGVMRLERREHFS